MQPVAGPGPEPSSWLDTLAGLRYVAAGGVAGAGARWAVLQSVAPQWTDHATAAINVAGALLLGLLVGLRQTRSGRHRLTSRQFSLLGGGFCGAFTSFSLYAVQVARALDQGTPARAAAVGLGTAAGAVLAAGLGYRLGSRP